VKRCGKSAPRLWQQRWQAKPRTEQDQIGERAASAARAVHPSSRVGRSIPSAMPGLEEWSSRRSAGRKAGAKADRIRPN
jgi:hypothetical protein